MRLPQKDLLPPPPLSRRHFLGLLGMSGVTLVGPFTASANISRPPDSSQGDKPRNVNGWLLRESDI